MMSNKKHKGALTISKYSMQPTVSISLEDELSSTRCLEIEMPLIDFAQAVMGLGYVKCEFEMYPERVGQKHENKTEEVILPILDTYERDKVIALTKKACKPFEVDGWEGYYQDALNYHRWVKNLNKTSAVYKIQFSRFVEVNEEQP